MRSGVKYSYAFGESNTSLRGDTMASRLQQVVKDHPDREALVVPYQQVRLTYRQLWEQTTLIAKALLAKGIQRGDRVGIWSPNRYEWVLVQYATALIGVISVNLNPSYRFNELLFAMNQSKLKLIFTVPQYRENDHMKVIDKAKSKALTLDGVIYFGHHTWEEFLHLSALKDDAVLHHAMKAVQIDDPINIQYTSGVTGTPKGATLSHFSTLNNAYFTTTRMAYTAAERVALPIPLFHSFSMVLGVLGTMVHGATLVLTGEHFVAKEVLGIIQKEKCTSLLAVPTMYTSLMNDKDFDQHDVSSLRTGIMGGAVCRPTTVRSAVEKMHLPDLTICFGMTETSPTATQTIPSTPLEQKSTTVGTVLEHVEIKVVDPQTGDIVPRGVEGEFCTRGYSVMLKYWEAEEDTAAVIDNARWMHSGDLVVMDEDGYVRITGRIKDVIIRGGENISPKEIEECIADHDSVADVQVIGVPDETYGEEVMAWVKLVEGCTPTVEELKAFCKGRISHYKIPRYWKFVEQMPVNSSGNVSKVSLKELVSKESLTAKENDVIDTKEERKRARQESA